MQLSHHRQGYATDQISEDLIDVVERDPVETFQDAQDLIRVETRMFTLNMEPSRLPAHRSDRLRVSLTPCTFRLPHTKMRSDGRSCRSRITEIPMTRSEGSGRDGYCQRSSSSPDVSSAPLDRAFVFGYAYIRR